jgi:hypothetical protein
MAIPKGFTIITTGDETRPLAWASLYAIVTGRIITISNGVLGVNTRARSVLLGRSSSGAVRGSCCLHTVNPTVADALC